MNDSSFTLYSAKTQLGGNELYLAMSFLNQPPLVESLGEVFYMQNFICNKSLIKGGKTND